ncbi:MAG: transcription antitermination factor NusB [Thermomicrobiales bacterium]
MIGATSRRVAWQVLHDWFCHPQDRVEPAVRQLTENHQLAGPDRGLVVELVYGVIRRHLTLDTLLSEVVRQPLPAMEPGLIALLRLGAYQQVFLPDMPRHAAVHETVNVARQIKKDRWVGITNAVLRNISGLVEGAYAGPVAANVIPVCVHAIDPNDADDTLPLCEGLKLSKALLPDPARESVAYLSKACSFPPRYVERRLNAVSWQIALHECAWFNTPGRLCLRVNRLRSDRDALLSELREAGVTCEPGEIEESIRVVGTGAIQHLAAMTEGRATLQDESAMWSARLLDPQPGECIWDVCAAPGGKTTHLAELAGDRASILATDVSVERLDRVREACDRLRLSSIEFKTISRHGRDMPEGSFDAVLLDVPCSNTGVMGKRPEVRWRLKSKDFRELADIQARLLNDSAQHVKPGGRLVYSTCSIDPAENQLQVASFIERHPEWTLDCERHHAPGQPCDGGYAALLRRE